MSKRNRAVKKEGTFATSAYRLGNVTSSFRTAFSLHSRALITGTNAVERKRWSEALAECRELLRTWPDLLPSHIRLGEAYHGTGDLSSAIGSYETGAGVGVGSPGTLDRRLGGHLRYQSTFRMTETYGRALVRGQETRAQHAFSENIPNEGDLRSGTPAL